MIYAFSFFASAAGFCLGALMIMVMSDRIHRVAGSEVFYVIMGVAALISGLTALDIGRGLCQ